jgi:hypothetical protein
VFGAASLDSAAIGSYAGGAILVAPACGERGGNAKKTSPLLIPDHPAQARAVKWAPPLAENALEESLLKRVSIFIAIALIALGAASQTYSLAQQPQQQQQQPRRRQRRPQRGVKPTPTPTPDMRAEASQVATQIKNVSNFIYIYGKIVSSLEFAEVQAKSNQTSPEIQGKVKESKDKLLAKIRDLRSGLEDMANNFRSNPRLQVQYLKLSYASDAANKAEQYALAGRYNEAGQSMITVVERLADTIVSMRLL